jgi:hypothetical protein
MKRSEPLRAEMRALPGVAPWLDRLKGMSDEAVIRAARPFTSGGYYKDPTCYWAVAYLESEARRLEQAGD